MADSKPNRSEKEQEEWYERTRYQVLLFVGGIVLFVVLVGWGLNRYIDPQTSTQKKDLVQALGLITAGVAGAGGIFLTWRGQRLAREAQEHNQRSTQEQLRLSRQSQEQNQRSTQAQLENAQEELRLTRQGQLTERFTRAIEQLGATNDQGEKKLEIRLGGIYALERIAKESPERAYHGTIMEVLTAYVRENSRSEPEEPSTSTTTSNEDVEQDKGVEQEAQPTLRGLPADILAILAVLKRRQEGSVPGEHRVLLDLREADLQGAPLQEVNLRKAYLQRAYLQRAQLERADLQYAVLQGANLHGANLHGANLRGADLQYADLQYADLHGAVLERANLKDLKGAQLRRSNLEGANLQEADLERADLQYADIRYAHLQEARLMEANLQGACFWGANLQGASLREANLQGAYPARVNLQGASLRGANLQGALLSGAKDLTQAQIQEAIGDENTKLPPHLKPPAHWGVKTDEQSEED